MAAGPPPSFSGPPAVPDTGYGFAVPPSGDAVPPPPPGPGVAPPFAAPPTDRDNKRLWIGLSLGAFLLVLCCGGGIGGIVLLSADGGLVEAQASAIVTDYLDAVVDEDYPAAYDMLCESVVEDVSLSEYESRTSRDPLKNYTIEDVSITNDEVLVQATLLSEASRTSVVEYELVQERGVLKICSGV